MKKKYESPELIFTRLSSSDLLNSSGEPGDAFGPDPYEDITKSF